MVVPEFPASNAAGASFSPCNPAPVTSNVSPTDRMLTPIASKHDRVLRASPPIDKPEITERPSANAEKSNARCEIDLSPGTRWLPVKGLRVMLPHKIRIPAPARGDSDSGANAGNVRVRSMDEVSDAGDVRRPASNGRHPSSFPADAGSPHAHSRLPARAPCGSGSSCPSRRCA